MNNIVWKIYRDVHHFTFRSLWHYMIVPRIGVAITYEFILSIKQIGTKFIVDTRRDNLNAFK